jgi:hypothetical protein
LKAIILLRLKTAKMIKKIILTLVLIVATISCATDDGLSNDNPYLIDVSFRMDLNLSLPEFNSLNFPGNSYYTNNQGINGVVVYNINNTQYTAFELSDPNHPLTDCSTLRVEGILVTCNCNDGNTYNILTGELTEGSGQYSLKPYRVRRNGNVLEVFN